MACSTYHNEQYILLFNTFKPVFHQNANPLALGPRVGHDTQCEDFVLPIPTYWYLKTLVDPTQSYNVRNAGKGIALVMSISCFMCSVSLYKGCQSKRGFWWNMGFTNRYLRRIPTCTDTINHYSYSIGVVIQYNSSVCDIPSICIPASHANLGL